MKRQPPNLPPNQCFLKFNEQNFSVTPLGGAQWHDHGGKLVKENVYNAVYPEVKKTADMRLYVK